MINVDFDEILNKMINKSMDIVNLNEFGFAVSDNDICKFNSIVILYHFNEVYDRLNNEQIDNINELYNNIML